MRVVAFIVVDAVDAADAAAALAAVATVAVCCFCCLGILLKWCLTNEACFLGQGCLDHYVPTAATPTAKTRA